MSGKLIVFEGLDRSGKTTQAHLLFDYLIYNDIQAVLLSFPERETTIGTLLDKFLKSNENLDKEALYLMFAANRYEMKGKINDYLQKGYYVILDRYKYSGLAYGLANGLDLEWMESIERALPNPAFKFYLDTSLDITSKRQGFGSERGETLSYQKMVLDGYHEILDNTWIILDGALEVKEIKRKIKAIVCPLYPHHHSTHCHKCGTDFYQGDSECVLENKGGDFYCSPECVSSM